MPKVKVCVEVSEDELLAWQREAERREVTVESLVERTVKILWEEMEREREEGTDHPVIPS